MKKNLKTYCVSIERKDKIIFESNMVVDYYEIKAEHLQEAIKKAANEAVNRGHMFEAYRVNNIYEAENAEQATVWSIPNTANTHLFIYYRNTNDITARLATPHSAIMMVTTLEDDILPYYQNEATADDFLEATTDLKHIAMKKGELEAYTCLIEDEPTAHGYKIAHSYGRRKNENGELETVLIKFIEVPPTPTLKRKTA